MIRTALADVALALLLCACSTTSTGTHVVTTSTVSDISYEAIGSADLAYEAANPAGVALVQVSRLDSATFHRLENQGLRGVTRATPGRRERARRHCGAVRPQNRADGPSAAAAALTSLEK